MRVLLAAPQDEEFGGVASVVGNLARYLQSRGHEVIFLYNGKAIFPKKKTTKWGFTGFELNLQLPFGERHPIISLMAFLIRFPIGMYQLIRIIQKHGIQVVNVHYPADCFVYFALCRRILPIVLVTSVHGADFFPGGKPKVKYSRAIRLLLSSSDRIVAPSLGYQKDFSSVFPDLKEKTMFIHNGVNLAELNGAFQDATRDSQDPYILCIAQHVEKKGLDVLLRAFKQLQDMDLLLKLILVGDGPLRGPLRDLASSLGINGRVEFLGEKGRAEVAKLLHGCEVFVLPSRSEPFGIVIVEALACKKPVVATSVGGILEIIDNGKNGILVEPDNPKALADALITLLKDHTLRASIATNGYVTAQERFSTKNNGSAYESVFASLVGSVSGQAP